MNGLGSMFELPGPPQRQEVDQANPSEEVLRAKSRPIGLFNLSKRTGARKALVVIPSRRGPIQIKQKGAIAKRTLKDRRVVPRGDPDRRKTPEEIKATPERPPGERRSGGPFESLVTAAKEFWASDAGKVVIVVGGGTLLLGGSLLGFRLYKKS